MTSPSITIRRVLAPVAVALAATVVAAAALATTPVAAAPPSTNPSTSAQVGARWLGAQVNAQGFVPGATGVPNIGATLQVGMTLADAGVEEATFDRIVAWAAADPDLVVTGGGADDIAGNLGWLLMIVAADGGDPTSFGGVDLVARLAGSLGSFAPGLYGAADPTYDGGFRQALAILGLQANGLVPPIAATDWLRDQQCDDATPAAEGGWEPFRADTSVACNAPDLNFFTGPDTNTTAMAIQALRGVAGFSGTAAGLDFLAGAQGGDAGFPYLPGGGADPNSTSLSIQAILAGGEDPTAGRWVRGAATPVSSLLSWQLGCAAPIADRGAFASPYSSGSPDLTASVQGNWGLTARPFPLMVPATFAVPVDPCAPLGATVPTSTTSTTSPPPGNAAVPVAAAPVAAAPALAG